MPNPSPIRLLSLNYEFPPIGGGGGNAHQNILRQFTAFDGLDVTLITATPQPNAYLEEYAGNVRVHHLPIKKASLHYWKRSEVIAYLMQHSGYIKKHLQANRYDLCHVLFGFPTGLLGYLNRKSVPYIVSVRGSDVPGYNQRFSLDYVFLRPLLNRIYHNAKAVVANSSSFGELFDRQFPGLKAEVIPNGIDTNVYAPSQGNGGKTVHLITVARLIPRKGIDLLIRACKQLSAKSIDFICHVAGEGPEEENLKTLAQELSISDRVRFHGRVEKEDLVELLPGCDVFVLPSYAEGMSNAALEALACGLPLVLTDTGGTMEMIDRNGFVVPCGDVDALADALVKLCSQPGLIGEMGTHSRRHAENFSWRSVAERYYQLYRRVVS